MGEIGSETDNENPKTANQAWRRKPRKFAPKSRLGCKTCKIRRIKCDLTQPSCMRCQSTGRTCDGYNQTPHAFKTEIESSPHHNDHYPSTTISPYQPKRWDVKYHDPIPQHLEPFMILPGTGPRQSEAMSFFEYISIKHLNEYHPCEPWRKTLMFFSQTEPSVRYAAVALALMQRNHFDRHSSGHVHQAQYSKDCLSDEAPLLYYNRAIQLLLNQANGDSTETTAITLLVCYLFTCFDQLAGNYVQSMKHLRGGVELSRNIDKAILDNNNTYDNAKSSGVHTLIRLVTEQIRRLDMQAVTFIVDWNPADMQEALMCQLPPSDSSAFRSLDQAADHLQVLVAQAMKLRNTKQRIFPMDKALLSSSPSSLKDTILEQLERWSYLFENTLLQQGNYYENDSETYPLVISLLRLQHTISWTLLSNLGPGRNEKDYDDFLPQFRQCMALARDIAATHERYAGSLSRPTFTFTPELGIVPVLYIIGAKCRDPVVRREVLKILRQQLIREAVWDSFLTARVVERIIEIEEKGAGALAQEEGGGEGRIQGMEQIPTCQRIEDLSWVHVLASRQFASRLDVSYTFCGREGVYTESLAL